MNGEPTPPSPIGSGDTPFGPGLTEPMSPDNGEQAFPAPPESPTAPGALEPAAGSPQTPAPGEGAVATPETPADLRARVIAQFEHWLDRMLTGEPPPPGLPEELLTEVEAAMAQDDGAATGLAGPGVDLYTLCAAVTKLSGEIGLQGRAFKQLSDVLSRLADAPERLDRLGAIQVAAVERMAALVERATQRDHEPGGLPSSRELLSLVMDLHDRLERGVRTLDELRDEPPPRRPNWLGRLLGRSPDLQPPPAADAMLEGYRLTLSRLEASLRQWDIERLGQAGDIFDPGTMTAIDVEESAEVEDGTVLEVYRSGYMLHGRILATAQVKVARAPAGETGE